MRQLTHHEASFIYSDTLHSNSNVTLLQIYDQSTAPGGKVRFKSILAHIESRLDRSAIFRSKLLRMPLELTYPYWIEDENFDLEYHVRHIALPKPGNWRQFCIQASRIHARPLDLNRPLWEIYVMEGLDSFVDLPAGSFALLIKIHHAAIDLEKGNDISDLLHDLTPVPPAPGPIKPWFPKSAPGRLRLLWKGALQAARHPLAPHPLIARTLFKVAPMAFNFMRDMLAEPVAMTSTRFNSVVSTYRVFDTRRFKLAQFKTIRALVSGATVNDTAIAICADALRRYLLEKNELPLTSLTAVAPVYVRDTVKSVKARPEVSWVRVAMGTDIADPVARLQKIHDQTAASAVIDKAIHAKELTNIAQHPPAATLALASKILAKAATDIDPRMPMANCSITNVPGSPKPLYLNGARMTYFSAIMPISDGMGLVLAITSYDGWIVISPTSCRYLMPDPDVFSQYLRDSFQDYLALAESLPVKAASPGKAKVSRASRTSKPKVAPAATQAAFAEVAKDVVAAAVPVKSVRRRASAAGTHGRASRSAQKASIAPPLAPGDQLSPTAP